MAHTIPFPFASHWDNTEFSSEMNESIAYFIQEYESNLADEDVCTDDGHYFYEGMQTAYADALCNILQVPEKAWDAYWNGPKTQFAIDPKGKVY